VSKVDDLRSVVSMEIEHETVIARLAVQNLEKCPHTAARLAIAAQSLAGAAAKLTRLWGELTAIEQIERGAK
jgi:hypothetical protein